MADKSKEQFSPNNKKWRLIIFKKKNLNRKKFNLADFLEKINFFFFKLQDFLVVEPLNEMFQFLVRLHSYQLIPIVRVQNCGKIQYWSNAISNKIRLTSARKLN
jgi:hypothetical protein